jgi:methylated-DNA-[protein]-cysteine S-methyltransferase
MARFLRGEAVALPIDLLDATVCTPFQWRVLMAEKAIPRGEVRTYGQIAAQVGCPRGARAVGNALANNPFPIVIPCHRAVRSDGSLGGFQGGVAMKRALLEMEGVRFDE